jgi:hypothetical protein
MRKRLRAGATSAACLPPSRYREPRPQIVHPASQLVKHRHCTQNTPAGVLSVMACLQHSSRWAIIATRKMTNQHFIPREATVAELEYKAAETERKAANESEPRATELREQAKLYREWAQSLTSGRWTSWRFFRISPAMLARPAAIKTIVPGSGVDVTSPSAL